MKRFLLAPLFALLGLLLPLAASADILTQVTVDCGDGSPLTASVDSQTVTSLQASIQGMIDNPSGITCSLSGATIPDPTIAVSGSSSGNAFVVGGGRYDRGPGPGSSQGCGVNFSLNAHSDNSGVHGEQSYTVNNADGCGSFEFNGHVKADVSCIAVAGNTAEMEGTITDVSGYYSTVLSVGDVLETDVIDNGNPSSGTPDMIGNNTYPNGTPITCANPQQAIFPVENGNITVHD